MSFVLGIDTSNYTTSVALFDTDKMLILNSKQLLPVKKGEIGIRQSDAVFHHTKQLPLVMQKLFSEKNVLLSSVGVSSKPRNIDGSYMPCFTVGESLAENLSYVSGISVHKTSHQVGHILAASFSAKKLELINGDFIAFHVSGGTTDCLLVSPCEENVILVEEIGCSLDLKAGQVVDRVGVMLGLSFPCGIMLEKLAEKSSSEFKVKATMKGGNCCLSGVENLCKKMLSDGEKPEDIAKFCLTYIYEAVKAMCENALKTHNNLPILFAGGVMSNKFIREKLENNFECYFAKPEFSADNAAGVAIYSALKEKLI